MYTGEAESGGRDPRSFQITRYFKTFVSKIQCEFEDGLDKIRKSVVIYIQERNVWHTKPQINNYKNLGDNKRCIVVT